MVRPDCRRTGPWSGPCVSDCKVYSLYSAVSAQYQNASKPRPMTLKHLHCTQRGSGSAREALAAKVRWVGGAKLIARPMRRARGRQTPRGRRRCPFR
eukprot:5978674-Prymnesium_polylepis.1